MNYELAKELKDAGFPQHPFVDGRDVYFRGVRTPFSTIRYAQYDNGQVVEYAAEVVRIPNLSELIEACGKNFGRLQLAHNGFYGVDKDGTIWGIEKTPEEAIARLWLALNK